MSVKREEKNTGERRRTVRLIVELLIPDEDPRLTRSVVL